MQFKLYHPRVAIIAITYHSSSWFLQMAHSGLGGVLPPVLYPVASLVLDPGPILIRGYSCARPHARLQWRKIFTISKPIRGLPPTMDKKLFPSNPNRQQPQQNAQTIRTGNLQEGNLHTWARDKFMLKHMPVRTMAA